MTTRLNPGGMLAPMSHLGLRLRSEGSRPELVSDGLLALAVLLFAQLDFWFNLDNSVHYGSDLTAAIVILVASSSLAFRRRAPLATVCVVSAAVAGPELAGQLTITLWGDFVPLLIATYSVARHGSRRVAIAGALVAAVALLVAALRLPAIGTVSNIPFTGIPFAGAVLAGRLLRARQLAHQQVSLHAHRLESERDETIRVAVSQERARIARELHDVVAHCVSLMVVQAGAAEDLLNRDPQRARQPLQTIQETGRQAVGDMQRMLGLLRGECSDRMLAPQPGTEQLGELVDHMAEAGLPVQLRIEGKRRPLPAGVELAAFRVVQEALTNILKHAGPAKASVVVRYGGDALELHVLDDGGGAAPDGSADASPGHGLIGIRERVAIYGGAVEAGPAADGGFELRARLPLDSAHP
jgi:signal transduction histidine kinase